MATKTRAELIDAVLKKLGVLGVGQSASAEDVSAIDDDIDAMAEELAGQEIVRLADTDDFELVIFDPLVTILTERAAPGYGRPGNIPIMEYAKQQLRVAARGGPTYETARGEYF